MENKLKALPNTPGIYKFLDKKGEILYIGKALNLNARVNSYFRDDITDRPRIRQMIPLVADLEIVETNNEIEALVLESALIKKYKPKFNSDLKDDKSYAWIYVSTKDEFPTVRIVRSITKGEYKRGKLFGPYPSGLAIKRVFTYLRKLYPFCTCTTISDKPCLYYHLGLCPAPYHGLISKEEYRRNIDEIVKFLSGKNRGHVKNLEREMKEYSKLKDYESAAKIRDRINDLNYLGEKIDFNYFKDASDYKSRRNLQRERSFEELSLELDIENLRRIECYDISNIQGKYAYGSMVVSIDGVLKRGEYRIFKIKGKDTPDDPAMLKEVLTRRFANKEFSDWPDIVLIDGAKSQLGVVKEYIPKEVCLMGISKGKHLKRSGKQQRDEFWILRDNDIFRIELDNPALLIDLRDEAHRFAIRHYRSKSIKEGKRSILESIQGVGEKRRKDLIKKFLTVDNIKKASIEEVDAVIKNRKVSEEILRVLLS